MSTLRSFTAGVTSPDNYGQPSFVSFPDRISGSSELFTLRSPPQNASKTEPVTDFFECYWAPRMRDTKLRHLFPWLLRLLLPPRGARALVWAYWSLVWVALIAAAASLAWGIGAIATERLHGALGGGLGLVISAVLGFFWTRYFLGYVGDAARYLSPDVSNIEARRDIRDAARNLLIRLHASRQYQRIVVVGHSLGSVIAYDVLARLWDDFRGDKKGLSAERQEVADVFPKPDCDAADYEERLREIENLSYDIRTGRLASSTQTCETLREKQSELARSMRNLGNQWLVTDLVTLGSPLAHAEYLLRVGGDDLENRIESREYPTCPPEENLWKDERYPENRRDRSIAYIPKNHSGNGVRIIIPSAVFAVVRWSNLYFPGDVIGGEICHPLGKCVTNIPVKWPTTSRAASTLLSWLPISHTKYWHYPGIRRVNPKNSEEQRFPVESSFAELRRALSLRSEDTMKFLKGTAGDCDAC